MAIQILTATRKSSSGLDQCKLVTAHKCLGKCSWTGERLMQRNTHHSKACMCPQLEVWERLGNSSTENSKILLLEEGKNEETGCPGPEDKRKFRLHSFSSDGKLAATKISWVLWEKQGWTGNTPTYRTPITSHTHIATPRRDLWSLVCCMHLCSCLCQKSFKKSGTKSKMCVSAHQQCGLHWRRK